MAKNESSILDDMQRQGATVPPAGSRRIRTRPEDFMKKGSKRSKARTMDVREAGKQLAGVHPVPQEALMAPAAGRTANFDPFGDMDPDPETGAEARLTTTTTVADDNKPMFVGAVPNAANEQPVIINSPRFAPPEPKRTRLIMGLTDGDMHIQVREVIVSTYGVVVLIPTDNSTMFLPKPGTEIGLSWEDKHEACYFPGVTFDLPMLQCMGLVFIKK